jgi:selenocysteine lyase/cysteine desulfurase
VARLLGAEREEIAFTESATRAWQSIFYSMRFAAGDRILTGRAEYASNYIAMLQVARRTGAELEVIPDDQHGQLDTNALERAIDRHVKLIAVTHIPSASGLVNPVEAAGAIARRANVTYLVDACQSAGQLPLDVGRIRCDFLVGTSRKYLRGPRGCGFLYARRDRTADIEPLMLDLHSAEWVSADRYEVRAGPARFEPFESSVASRIGLGAAAEYALEHDLDAIEHRVTALAAELRHRLRALPGVTVHDRGERLCGIVTFTVAGVDAGAVRRRLAKQRMNVWTSPLGSARLAVWPAGVDEVVRASVHYYNDEPEVDRFTAAVAGLERS